MPSLDPTPDAAGRSPASRSGTQTAIVPGTTSVNSRFLRSSTALHYEAMSRRSASGFDLEPLAPADRARLAAGLSREERRVLVEHGTEPPFCGTLLNTKADGVYACRLCELPLFRSRTKFESGTGWPSFFEPFDPDHVTQVRDLSYGMQRVEIRCRRCDGHLGHVFDDGPPPTGQRYCLNSASLSFVPAGTGPPPDAPPNR